MLGICYGLQFMVHTLGGKVRPADKREYGHAEIDIVAESALFHGLENGSRSGCRTGTRRWSCLLALSSQPRLLTQLREFRMWQSSGLQCSFIPRFTTRGMERKFCVILCFKSAERSRLWTPQHFIDSTIEQVRQQVGKGRAICALSGGVDSSVAAVLVDRALRDANGSRV